MTALQPYTCHRILNRIGIYKTPAKATVLKSNSTRIRGRGSNSNRATLHGDQQGSRERAEKFSSNVVTYSDYKHKLKQ